MATCRPLPALEGMEDDSLPMEDDSLPTKKRRPSMGWTCFRCAANHEAHGRFTVVTLAMHGSAQLQQLTMCLWCKWADPSLWVQGQQRLMEPGLAEAMAAVREVYNAALPGVGGELTEHANACLEQHALQVLQGRKLNPRLSNSECLRGF